MKNNSAGALLFAIITAFVLSLVGSTLVFLTTNQYRLINSEIERTKAFYLAQAGMEYAIWWARENPDLLPSADDPPLPITPDPALTALNDVVITITNITNEVNPLSGYRISITSTYQS